MEKRKTYIAAPLFSEGERAFNERIDAILRECGHETFLPQREGGCVADLPELIEGMPKRKYLFRLDCALETVLRSEQELRAFFALE